MPEPLLGPLFEGTIRWASVGPLLLTSLVVMGSPGPATVSLTAAGSAYGVRRSCAYLTGIIAGTILVLLAVASGITVALLAVPALRIGLLAVSVAYILWLAYHIATVPPLAARLAALGRPSFAGGTLLGVANPKAWVVIAAVFASTRLAGNPAADSVAKVVILTAMIVLINVTWLITGASLAPLLRHPVRSRVTNAAILH